MSEKPPRKEISKIKIVSRPATDTLDDALDRFFAHENEVDGELETRREGTRNHITRVVLWAFAGLIGLFALSLCYLCVFGDVSRVPLLLESTKTLTGIVTPIVTFILGFYYATKAAN